MNTGHLRITPKARRKGSEGWPRTDPGRKVGKNRHQTCREKSAATRGRPGGGRRTRSLKISGESAIRSAVYSMGGKGESGNIPPLKKEEEERWFGRGGRGNNRNFS